MSLSNKTSLQIAQQLPEFIRDDVNYENFVLFLEAYYEWLETQYAANANSAIVSTTSQGVTYGSKNILNYIDIDNTLDGFVQYFINDFLPYIPPDVLSDKRKLLKLSKQFYQSKGTEKSYKFLFRVLYDSNAQIFNTNDVILRASDGKWIVPRYLRVDSTEHTEEMHEHWLMTVGFKVFGETSKSYATIDFVKITDTTTEIYISGIQRGFQAGENITVVDNNNLPVYFYDGEVYVQNQGYEIPMMAMMLSDRISGGVNSIIVNPDFRGLFYNPGDPVVAYGGLNPEKANAVGLTAQVNETNFGSLSTLVVVNPSHGYRLPPNTLISITGGGGSNAAAQVSLLDESKFANLTLITSNTLGAVANVLLGNTTNPVTYTFGGAGVILPGNTNTTLANTLTFKSFVVAPIGSVQITNAGRNYTGTPTISAQSNYTTDFGTDDFKFLGILQPIRIVNAGIKYGNSNTITIQGGTGFGAFANITVNAAGSIISANYVYRSSNSAYPLGGLGYDPNYLPTVNISSLSGSNASLIIPGVMAVGATFSPTTDSIGSIQSITITNPGEDYVSTPNISLKVADVAVTNVSTTYSIISGDLIYQGSSSNNTTYYAYVDSIIKLSTAVPPNTANDVYQIRTYNFVGSYNSNLPLKIDKNDGGTIVTLEMIPNNSYLDEFGNPISLKRYGDGTAKATASFLGGTVTGQGRYLNDDGWISSLGRVLESKDYNKYTYILSSSQALAKYKELVLNLLHPSGMRLIGRNIIRSANSFNFSSDDALQTGVPLSYVAGTAAYATLQVQRNVPGAPFMTASKATMYSTDTGYIVKTDGTLWQSGFSTGISSPTQIYSNYVWKDIVGSTQFYLAIQSNGTLWAYGVNNNFGQLGLGDTTARLSPTKIETERYWKDIATGSNHSLAIQSNGTLWAWGQNNIGQLGTSNVINRSSPVRVGALSVWTQIACGYSFSLALQSNGTLWSWGLNDVGQLGLSNLTNRSSPVQVGTESYWTRISVGLDHTLAIQSNGTLWVWGYNNLGQLGLGDLTDRLSPVQVGTESYWTNITGLTGRSLALQSDGTLWSWGYNLFGQLGLSDTTDRSSPVQIGALSVWTAVNGNDYHSLAIQSNGTLWAWGLNNVGQLGLSDLTDRLSPVQVGTLSVWSQISCGYGHALAIQSNGTLWSWGNNSNGQLGLSDLTDRLSPVQVGTESYWTKISSDMDHNLSLQSNNTNSTLWSWGYNSQGQLGLSDLTTRSSPTQVGLERYWRTISLGQYHSLAIQSDGSLWSWGFGNSGQLGLGNRSSRSSPIQVGTENYWTAIATGPNHSLAIQSNGTLWSWGRNQAGQLGLSNRTDRSSPVQVGTESNWSQITAGGISGLYDGYSSFALQSNGTLWAWGSNSFGQLGVGNLTRRSSPVQVGNLSVWTQIKSASGSVAALQSDGTLWSWGKNAYGQLGLGDLTDRSSPVQIGLSNTWSQILLMDQSFFAQQNDGTLWACGYNQYGQLGIQSNVDTTVLTRLSALNVNTSSISNNIIKLTNVIAGNIGNTIFANDIIEFTATNNVRAYSTITHVDWANNDIYTQDNVFLTFANVAYANVGENYYSSTAYINIINLTGQFDGNFKNLTPANVIFNVGDYISLNSGPMTYQIEHVYNDAIEISGYFGDSIANTTITVNKNANTQSVIIYGDVELYDTPQLTTEDGDSLLTENDLFILIG